jgi:hypothetical protein
MKSQRSPVPTLFLMIILRATLSLFQTILIVRFATIDDPGGLFATRWLMFWGSAVVSATMWACGRFFPPSRSAESGT